MTEPILSVLMTVHNGEPYIKESVASILNQTYKKFNFYILDNASSDDSTKIIKSFNDKRIKLIKLSSDIGQTRALNLGLKMIKTKYTARMDADDIALPTRFEKQIKYLMNNPNVSIVGTNHFIIDKNNKKIGFYNWPKTNQKCGFSIIIKGQTPVGHPMVMFKTKEIVKLGGYKTNFKFGQDLDLWFRSFEKNYEFNNIQQKLFKFRKADTQGSNVYLNEQTNDGNNAYADFIKRNNFLDRVYSDSVLMNLRHINNIINNAPDELNSFLEIKVDLLQLFFSKYPLDNKRKLSYIAKFWVYLLPTVIYKPIYIFKVILKNMKVCFIILKKNIRLNVYNFIYYFLMLFYFCFIEVNKMAFYYYYSNIKPRRMVNNFRY